MTAASATLMTSSGRLNRIFRTSENSLTASCGRFVMSVGTCPASSCCTNCLAASASVTRVLILLQGISAIYCPILPWLEERRPCTMLLAVVSVGGARALSRGFE